MKLDKETLLLVIGAGLCAIGQVTPGAWLLVVWVCAYHC